MLEYSKTILEKVAFDSFLFNKELKKAEKFLTESEMAELAHWCSKRFGREINSSLLVKNGNAELN